LYCIIDIETTGGKFNEEGITEIAIHKFDGIQVVDSFISLINSEKPIQPFVVQLTGINSKMLRNAPKFHEVAKRILEIMDGAVFIAHNVSFDYRIIQNAYKELGYDFQMPKLCSIELSKRLFPDQASYSLGKLCKSLGIPFSNRHRANGDALATVKLFELLLAKDSEKIIIQELINKKEKRKALSTKYVDLIADLPNTMGLFYVYDKKGLLIYIGSGKNIKQALNKLLLKEGKLANIIRKKVDLVTFELTGNQLITKLKLQNELVINKPFLNRKPKQKKLIVDFASPNMIIVNQGRYIEENAILLIEDNIIIGYAFVDLTYQVTQMDILKAILIPLENSILNRQIIKHHLLHYKVKEIIRF
jgi:DNA polymerase-3 subunit epsilon